MKKFILGLAVFIFTIPGIAKDFTIPELHIEVEVNADGTLHITEHRTYQFDGSFSWANYKLPKAGYSRIRNISVSEGDSSFINRNTEERGTFLVEESDGFYNIRWFYEAENEKRVFTVSYTLEGAVTTGPDWSEFFWTYAAAGREKSTDRFTVSIQLPEEVPGSDLHSWVREPEWAVDSRTTDTGFEFTGSDINRKQAVTIRTVFPTAVFNSDNITISDNNFSLARVKMDEETYRQEQREREEREAYLEETGIRAGVILVVLSLAAFIFFYRRYGVRHKVHSSNRESLMIPGDIQPAVIGWLLYSRTTTGSHMFATLLDLARRKYFTITEKAGKKKMFSENKPEFVVATTGKEPGRDLQEWEQSLLEFVRGRIRDGHETPEEIFKYETSSVSKWYSSWKKKVKAYGFDKGWIDRESYRGANFNGAVQFLLILLAVAGMIFIHKIMFVALLLILAAAGFSFAIIRRTPEGEKMYQSWKSYRRALQNAKDYQVPENHLGRHFIYSVAFDVSKKRIEKLFEENADSVSFIYWIAILPGSRHTPAEVASSFSSLSSTGTASFGGGAGAGASAGAAGGGASGGAG